MRRVQGAGMSAYLSSGRKEREGVKPPTHDHGGRPAGFPARLAGCIGTVTLLCVVLGVLVAAGLLFWFFHQVTEDEHDRQRESRTAVADSAGQLRARLEKADSDGTLTTREIQETVGRRLRSLDRSATRTVVVAQIAAGDWAQCYSYTARPSGAVTATPLTGCRQGLPSPQLLRQQP